MTSRQRVQAVIEGRLPDRVPVSLHNFLPAAREAGITMKQYRTDPEAVAQAHLQAYEKYRHDCILIDLDTTLLAEAMGARSDAAADAPGHIANPAISSLDEVGSLKPVDPLQDGRLPVLIEAIRLLDKAV
ncbi:MAG: uroporphyrinogen decarboxylase family protein, partial [Terrimicrobiaceae bacterium]